jgi:phosphohistidine phosphatase
MKTLSIIRHAKAARSEEYASDFERPLTERGERDASRLGALLHRLEPPADWWVSSPATRTRQTTEQMSEACGFGGEIQWSPEVYEAGADELLALLGKIPPDALHTVIVGHNPGMEALVSGLAAGAPGRLNLHMTPATLALIRLEIVRWNQIRWGAGRLELLATPKALKK